MCVLKESMSSTLNEGGSAIFRFLDITLASNQVIYHFAMEQHVGFNHQSQRLVCLAGAGNRPEDGSLLLDLQHLTLRTPDSSLTLVEDLSLQVMLTMAKFHLDLDHCARSVPDRLEWPC